MCERCAPHYTSLPTKLEGLQGELETKPGFWWCESIKSLGVFAHFVSARDAWPGYMRLGYNQACVYMKYLAQRGHVGVYNDIVVTLY